MAHETRRCPEAKLHPSTKAFLALPYMKPNVWFRTTEKKEEAMDEHEGKSGTAQSVPKKGKGGFFYGWVITAACGLVYLLLGSVSLNAG